MTAVLAPLSSALLAAYSKGTELFLFFDYDGTLVPIVEHPRLARLSEQAHATLERLARLPNVHLGVISGRQHLELKQVVPIPGLFLAGTSGLELDFRGITVTHPMVGNALPLLRHVEEGLISRTKKFQGAWLERKRVGLTVHYRRVGDAATPHLRQLVREFLGPYGHQLRLVDGSLALEITPNLGWTKGTAVRMFLDALRPHAPMVLYAGDNANDTDAICVVDEFIGVGAEAPEAARHHMASPEHLINWLSSLERSLSRSARGLVCG